MDNLRVIQYVRVRSKNRLAQEVQDRRRIQEFIRSRGWTTHSAYYDSDRGDDPRNRRVFWMLIGAISSGAVDIVLIASRASVSATPEFATKAIQSIEFAGQCQVVACDEATGAGLEV